MDIMGMKALLPTALLCVACGGNASHDPPSSSEFVGTWSCPTNGGRGPAQLITVTASGSELKEAFSFNVPLAGAINCTALFSVSGSTATLIASQFTCTGPAAKDLTGTPSSETETVSGNTMTLTGAYEGGPPSTATCTRQ